MIRRLLALLALVATLVLLQAPPVLAADDQVVFDTTVHTVQILSLFIGTVLPILVGLVTKRVTSSAVKAWLLALFSAVSGFATEYAASLQDGTAFNLTAAILTWGGTFIVAVAVHFGLWQPTGVAAKAQASLVK